MNDSAQSSNRLIILITLLNSADTVLTSWSLDLGAIEFNPIVDSVLSHGMTWFLFYKLILVNSMVVFVGFFSRKYRISKIGLSITAWVYSALIFWHFVNLGPLFMTGN